MCDVCRDETGTLLLVFPILSDDCRVSCISHGFLRRTLSGCGKTKQKSHAGGNAKTRLQYWDSKMAGFQTTASHEWRKSLNLVINILMPEYLSMFGNVGHGHGLHALPPPLIFNFALHLILYLSIYLKTIPYFKIDWNSKIHTVTGLSSLGTRSSYTVSIH